MIKQSNNLGNCMFRENSYYKDNKQHSVVCYAPGDVLAPDGTWPSGKQCCQPRPVFCLLLVVSSDYAQPITGQVTEVTCHVIGRAQPEFTPSKRQRTGPGYSWSWNFLCLGTRSRWSDDNIQNDRRDLAKSSSTWHVNFKLNMSKRHIENDIVAFREWLFGLKSPFLVCSSLKNFRKTSTA